MPIQIKLVESQLKDLAVIRNIGDSNLGSFINKLKSFQTPPLKVEDLTRVWCEVLPEHKGSATAIIRMVLFFYTFRRQQSFSEKEVWEGIINGLKNVPSEYRWNKKELKEWEKIESLFIELLSIDNVWTVSKALELGYDYTNLLQSARIITDIRPIFNINADDINGSVITYTLRLNFDSQGRNETLSIALDEKDVVTIRESCERALKKAKTAKSFMCSEGNKPSLILGTER